MFDEIPVTDIDCVDNETILIVERDAGDVIVLVAGVLIIENLLDAILAVGVFVDEIPIVVPVGFVLALVRELSMMTVPFIEELETIGLITEDPVPGRPVAEVPVVTWSLVDEAEVVKGAPVEVRVAEPIFMEEMLVVVAVGGRSVGELERETPLA